MDIKQKKQQLYANQLHRAVKSTQALYRITREI